MSETVRVYLTTLCPPRCKVGETERHFGYDFLHKEGGIREAQIPLGLVDNEIKAGRVVLASDIETIEEVRKKEQSLSNLEGLTKAELLGLAYERFGKLLDSTLSKRLLIFEIENLINQQKSAENKEDSVEVL